MVGIGLPSYLKLCRPTARKTCAPSACHRYQARFSQRFCCIFSSRPLPVNASWTVEQCSGCTNPRGLLRTVDFYLGDLVDRWQEEKETWLISHADVIPIKLFNILFADDLILLACSFRQLQHMLLQVQACLAAVGLTLCLARCKIPAAPFVAPEPIVIDGQTLPQVESFTFLGVLIGFHLPCQAVLNARLAQATNAFWGHFKLLKRPVGSIKKKFHLLNSYVTSKWRWMSASVRPINAVQKSLRILHTSFLGALCRYSSDPFTPPKFNWVVRAADCNLWLRRNRYLYCCRD